MNDDAENYHEPGDVLVFEYRYTKAHVRIFVSAICATIDVVAQSDGVTSLTSGNFGNPLEGYEKQDA